MKKNEIVEPKAKKIEKVLKMHEHERIDEFYWLNERDNPEVIKYLEEENNYSCLLYTSPSPRDNKASRMPSSA